MLSINVKPVPPIARIQRYFRQRPEAIKREAAVGMQKVVNRVRRHIAISKLSGSGPQSLNVRSGALRRSLDDRVETGKGGMPVGAVGFEKGPASRYARIQEFGGVIRPRRSKYLAVPLDAARFPSGVPRYPDGPRSLGDLDFIPRSSGRHLLARRGKDGSIVPLFVLLKEVRIKERAPLRRGATEQRQAIGRDLNQAVQRAMQDDGVSG